MTVDELRRFYAEENVRLFEGKLPTVELREGTVEEMAKAHEEAHARLVPRALSEDLRVFRPEWLMVRADVLSAGGLTLRRAVLHEMAHIACCGVPTPVFRKADRPGLVFFVGNGHDGAFLTELERLGERGEEWVDEEIEEYAEFAVRTLKELQPVLWQRLYDAVKADAEADRAEAGWEGRFLGRTGTASMAHLESAVTGVSFWYRWLRRQIREQAV